MILGARNSFRFAGPVSSAPKGRNSSAQANGLGMRSGGNGGLKGSDTGKVRVVQPARISIEPSHRNGPNAGSIPSPYIGPSALPIVCIKNPGRWPGLRDFALWGLKTGTSAVVGALNYFGRVAAGASFRENSAVLLR